MNTSTADIGSLLSVATRGHPETFANKRDVSKAQQQPSNRATGTVAGAEIAKAGHDTPARRAQLSEALERVSRLDQRLSFTVDEDSGKSVVTVRDAQTLEVLKQFPSEEMLNVARRLEEHLQQSVDAAGVLHTDKV